MQSNQSYQWRYVTPTRYYYGNSDEAVAPIIATLPINYEKVMSGASCTAVYAGDDADHRNTFIYSLYDERTWFDSLLNK